MCTGLEVAAIGAMLGGSGMQLAAGQAEKNAMNQATEAELKRQQDYARKGQAAFEASLAQSRPQAVEEQMKQGTAQAAAEYAKVQQNQLPGLSQGTAQITPNAQLAATENALVSGRVGQQNAAASALQGYQASDVAQSLKDLEAKTRLGQISDYARASERVLPLELQAASQSQDTLKGIGSLLSTAGGLAGLYGALGAAAPAASAGTGSYTIMPDLASGASGGIAPIGGAAFGPAYGIAPGASWATTGAAPLGWSQLGYGSIANTPSVYAPLAGGQMPSWGGSGLQYFRGF